MKRYEQICIAAENKRITKRAAKQIGLTLSPDLLSRANKVLKEASAKAGGR